MWCFEIMNKNGEERCIFGYNFKSACCKYNLNPEEWNVVDKYYED